MKIEFTVDAEREEGLNVSKDALAEEVEAFLVGAELDVDIVDEYDEDEGEEVEHEQETESITVTNVTYLGSGKGKPMKFELLTEMPVNSVELESVGDALTYLLEGEQLSCDVHDNGPSEYSITMVDVTNIDIL